MLSELPASSFVCECWLKTSSVVPSHLSGELQCDFLLAASSCSQRSLCVDFPFPSSTELLTNLNHLFKALHSSQVSGHTPDPRQNFFHFVSQPELFLSASSVSPPLQSQIKRRPSPAPEGHRTLRTALFCCIPPCSALFRHSHAFFTC